MSERSVRQITGEDVRAIRSKTGMTQKQFCDSFGFNINTLRHWERGDRSPSGAALAILNLLEASPEVVHDLKRREAKRMAPSEEKDILKALVVNQPRKTLYELLKDNSQNTPKIIFALLRSVGVIYKKSEEKNGLILFYAGHDSENLKLALRVDKVSEEISGEYNTVLEKALAVIHAIENELNSAVLLPHEMRQRKIQAVIQRLDVDEAFYSTVLRNW
ncbi:helix-turn-helix domain-containing protein [Marinobacter sp.]|uniref:helix-turn-helix domain-containing protein n=1 Tax=Marinobacter sp. TaxID=50741 RepID=UPI002357B76B|nr:helix-turn-helix domain-containing protein [Marinobacter sp.]